MVEPYLEYARSHKTRNRISRMRSGRVRVRHSDPRGRHFDLSALFDELNAKYFDGRVAAAADRLERAELAAAVWLLRSGAESDFVEQADGSSGSAGLRGGICFISRDAARETSYTAVGLQPGVAFTGISRRGKTFCGI